MIYTLANAVNIFFEALSMAIVVRILLSWFIRGYSNNKFYSMLIQITEPVLAPFRRITYRFGASYGIDFSPVLAILALEFVRMICMRFLFLFY